MKKVLFIIGHLGLGGAEIQLFHLASYLREFGYDPYVAVLVPGGRIESWFRDREIPLHILRRSRLNRVGRVAQLHRCIRIVKPDIIHTKLMDANLAGGLAALLAGHRRVVFTELGPGTRVSTPMRFFRRYLSLTGAATVCNSSHVLESLSAHWPTPRHLVIRNGLADHWFDAPTARMEGRRALDLPPDAWVVAIVSHFTHSKNIELFLQAARRVVDAVPDALFVIAGDGPRRQQCEDLIRSLELNDRVRVLGEIPDAKPLLHAADVFTLTSRSEGLPNALMEAMASGLPCIATDVGGCSEIIPSPEYGILVPSDEPEPLADAIRSLHADPEGALKMAERGQALMKKTFSLEAMVGATVGLYDRLLSDGQLPAVMNEADRKSGKTLNPTRE